MFIASASLSAFKAPKERQACRFFGAWDPKLVCQFYKHSVPTALSEHIPKPRDITSS
jgi:hypothetical protein